MRSFWIILFVGFVASLRGFADDTADTSTPPAAAKSLPVEITADGETNFEGGMATAKENVVVRYGSDLLYADRVSYDAAKHVAIADGNVRLYVGDRVYRGEHMIYNFDTKAVTSTDFGLAQFPVFGKGEKVSSPAENHYLITNGFLTTDNRAHPSFYVKAHTIDIYPDDRVVLKNVVLYVSDVPILWVPIYSQSLTSSSTTFNLRGGSDSRFGEEVFVTLNWKVSDNLEMAFHEDYRSKRGDGGGVDANYKLTRDSTGLFSGYYLRDGDSEENPTILPRSPIDSDRYRFSLQQITPLGQNKDLELKINANVWSDPYVTEDFFQNEFSQLRMPDNTVELVARGSDFEFSVLGRPQVNRFFDTTERAPEVRLESKPIKLFDDNNLQYQTESSVVNFTQEYSNQQYLYPTLPKDYSADRWDTYHQFLYPGQYFDWLSMTPHVGLRGTAYSHNNLDVDSVSGDRTGPSVERGVVDVGDDFSFKVSRTWSDAQNDKLAIDGLRHVLSPFVNVEAVLPSDNQNDFKGFDTRLPNTWANPIDFPSYNSIDSINREMVIRQGIRNEIQTKRDGQNWDLIDWSVFTDLNLTGHYDEEQNYTHDAYSHVYNDTKLSPVSWLTFESRDAMPVDSGTYSMYDNSISWQPDRSYKFSLGDRLLENSDILDSYGILIPNSNQIYFKTFYRLNEHWQFETIHSFDSDDSQLQQQSYSVYRDLSAWQLGATFSQISNHDSASEEVLFFTFTLKAFPNTGVHVSE